MKQEDQVGFGQMEARVRSEYVLGDRRLDEGEIPSVVLIL